MTGRLRHEKAVVPALLVLLALAYYGSYYAHGFLIADEGNIALIGKRLLEGEVPFEQIHFGAGLAWPYSVAALFGLVGVNFVAMKVYFYCLATVAALLAYATVVLATSNRWLGLLAGILLILVPGSVHKVFIPLAVVGNMFVMVRTGLGRGTASSRDVAVASATASATFLLRTDLGMTATAVLAALLGCEIFGAARSRRQRLRLGAVAAATGVGVLLPSFVFAAVGGFFRPYLRTYTHRPVKLVELLQERFRDTPGEAGATDHLLAAPPMARIFDDGQLQIQALLTYLPLLVLLGGFAVLLAWTVRSSPEGGASRWMKLANPWGVLMILAASTYPQFLIWRPDVAHLSQFMPGFVVFSCCAMSALLAGLDGDEEAGDRGWLRKTLIALPVLALCAQLALYGWFSLQHQATGSIARRQGSQLLEGANGVRVRLPSRQYEGLRTLQRAILAGAGPAEEVFCFPYAPGLNLMADRPTRQRRLYASSRRGAGWQDETLDLILESPPAVVVISNWAVNSTESSRFPNWALRVMSYVLDNYEPVAEALRHTVYVRRSRGAGIPPLRAVEAGDGAAGNGRSRQAGGE